VAPARSYACTVNKWNVQIVLEALNDDVITWTLSDEGLDSLRADIKAGELGRAHIMRVDPLRDAGLVALAA
jgi:hypothetical protein